ncbi:fatty acid desaturase [Pseudenhygromyxa sp. WMMC2535]|uniref:fatty acid desaturase family protein n=1 Tax=Pseudenhygromyxa sp. WMMC2535 TaxID=2712867 RepID=UPI001557BAAA|nr:fatty acid desaturase [Pseudenhygromyxa sp. WMMC2535]NVB41144.1 fatty acid desaturase [Pseudenhygromyxa sp. WMMC2535]
MSTGGSVAAGRPEALARPRRLVRRREEWRQVGIVGVYWGLLGSMMFLPAARNLLVFAAACYFSFLNTVVIHNHLHQGIFESKRLNLIWRAVLSFGALYPASANIPSHNLVHHHFDDDGDLDWASPKHVRFRWNLLNLLHFPNVAGPRTFAGVKRWAAWSRHPSFVRQYRLESAFAFGLTGLLLAVDFWTALLFVVVPQLYGARGILRVNLIQHDRADVGSEWNHSRNFVGRGFNWIMCNNGYHTIHHNRAGLHWSELDAAHAREVVPRMDPRLDEPSMVAYLLRTYLSNWRRPGDLELHDREPAAVTDTDANADANADADTAGRALAPRERRRAEADACALAESAA